jgi:hypothetical protein
MVDFKISFSAYIPPLFKKRHTQLYPNSDRSNFGDVSGSDAGA